MEITEDEIIQKMLNNADTAIEILYFHMNMNGPAFHVVRT